ncbi:hypothetical protein [Cellulophaga baltica]|uniref:hypothetical protein n=1 Tax=Cellulophaga baltica TaxID=76594 RepID=UPI002495A02E|nr:hypothetical protein [Cellulophaga baltica]
MNLKELEDKIALKKLINTVSILTDRKDLISQVQLFSRNAVSQTFAERKSILKLKDRKGIKEAFSNFLKEYETV